jgi:hypothetical protein
MQCVLQEAFDLFFVHQKYKSKDFMLLHNIRALNF